jgi:hypothetical protein
MTDYSKITTELPATVGISKDLLNAPLFVLHSTAATKTNLLEVKWKEEKTINGRVQTIKRKFSYIRSTAEPFPTVCHAIYLDILLCLFAKNWNEDGILYFRYKDILIAAGKSIKSSATPIQTTIQRYRRHQTEWESIDEDGTIDNTNYPIIRSSSILDSDGQIIKGKKAKNPRRANSQDNWHRVTFDQEIVKALDPKKEQKRFLLTKAFKILKADSFCVYRYYYGFPDTRVDKTTGKKKPVYHFRSLEQLHKVFNWTGQKNRFKPWLEARFAELLKHNLIDKPFWTSETSVKIRCNNHTEVTEKKQLIQSPTQGKLDLNNITEVALVSEYIRLKSEKIIPEASCIAIDMVISVPALKSNAFPMIKKLILEHTQQQP